MFWVRWHKLWKINTLLWRYFFNLTAEEKAFLGNIREDLRTNRRELTGKQDAWLYILYDRERRRQRHGHT